MRPATLLLSLLLALAIQPLLGAQDLAPSAQATPRPRVLSGLDVLRARGFAGLEGQRVALLTHAPGRAFDGTRGVDLLALAPGVELVRVFTPEHGLGSSLEGQVADGRDDATGLPLVSLYGEHRRPRPTDLEGLDAVLVDLQGAGVRFYTYATTLGYMLEACGAAGVRVVVLDRPNPLGGLLVEGPLADEERLSFIAYRPVPVVHGLTMGEMAQLIRRGFGVDCELSVVPLEGWRRSMRYEDTGLPWIPPSPNLRNPTQAYLYPAVGLLEATDLSVGRGTDEPFERLGAPWVDGVALAAALEAAEIPGLRFTPIEFRPRESRHAGRLCQGVQLRLADLEALRPVAAGLELARVLERLHPEAFDEAKVDDRLLAAAAFRAWRQGRPLELVPAEFLSLRRSCLLYP